MEALTEEMLRLTPAKRCTKRGPLRVTRATVRNKRLLHLGQC